MSAWTKYASNFLPSLNFVALVALLSGLGTLVGTMYPKDESCKSWQCVLFSSTFIVLGVAILVLNMPPVSKNFSPTLRKVLLYSLGGAGALVCLILLIDNQRSSDDDVVSTRTLRTRTRRSHDGVFVTIWFIVFVLTLVACATSNTGACIAGAFALR